MSTTKLGTNIKEETVTLTNKIKEETAKLEEKTKTIETWCFTIFIILFLLLVFLYFDKQEESKMALLTLIKALPLPPAT